jgi:Cu+-exporting ATPase
MEEEIQYVLNVEGMMCTHCQSRVHDAIVSVSGVKQAQVDYQTGQASITMEEDTRVQEIIDSIQKAGYLVKQEEVMKKSIQVEGMMCMHCVAHVKEALEKVEGVSEVEVSLEEKKATFVAQDGLEDTIQQAIKDAGYQPGDIE